MSLLCYVNSRWAEFRLNIAKSPRQPNCFIKSTNGLKAITLHYQNGCLFTLFTRFFIGYVFA